MTNADFDTGHFHTNSYELEEFLTKMTDFVQVQSIFCFLGVLPGCTTWQLFFSSGGVMWSVPQESLQPGVMLINPNTGILN